jgi:hypothetical protein
LPPPPPSVSDSVERGPLKLTVEARPKEAWFGDPVTIELRFTAPQEFVVRFPTAAEALSGIPLRDERRADPRPAAEGGLEWRQTFVVEPAASGVLDIPAIAVRYARKPGDGKEPAFDSELTAGPLKIDVRSALTTQDSVSAPRDITGTLVPPRPSDVWRWAALAGAASAALLLALLGTRWLMRRLRRPPPPVLPEVWALRALGELSPEWVGSGRAREYYYRLSEIVRGYIERKFAVAAPEMTTEEFLLKLGADVERWARPTAAATERGRRRRGSRVPAATQVALGEALHPVLRGHAPQLREFMEACDVVKYAAWSPRREDAERALGTARNFVDMTAAMLSLWSGSGAVIPAGMATNGGAGASA